MLGVLSLSVSVAYVAMQMWLLIWLARVLETHALLQTLAGSQDSKRPSSQRALLVYRQVVLSCQCGKAAMSHEMSIIAKVLPPCSQL